MNKKEYGAPGEIRMRCSFRTRDRIHRLIFDFEHWLTAEEIYDI
tara:strand:- start:2518 stop:2649 length:132 start_codon:yes stop_codon:yes gene_type:complete